MSAFDRAFDRQLGESNKAFEAYKVYRDLGSDRSLVKAAEIYYGSSLNLAQLKVWSKKFSWVDRAAAYEDWMELIRRTAVEEHVQARADDHALREVALQEAALEAREQAMSQVKAMLRWPLAEQRVINESEDVTYVFYPARWNKATAVSLYNLAMGDAPEELPDETVELDFSALSDEEIDLYIQLHNKVGIRPKEPPEGR